MFLIPHINYYDNHHYFANHESKETITGLTTQIPSQMNI